ncbi:MAG TPA: class I SAM-dependent methyltransferase [Casimicrobiaceae bacterium]|jgi:hypothetical protein|nr:class I SAM-dependent methyltransferase [Casimicrobiaceae bacterium]
MNDLEAYFVNNPGRMIHKWWHYFEIYDRHLSRFRGTEVNLVEIGVYQGGSLQMWKHYFGERARIWGIDINPAVKQFAEDGINIIVGDQADREFLRALARDVPQIDILIDDGGHTMVQQRTTMEELFPKIDAHGVYICEDLHTSYWREFGGGHLDPRSFVEFSKNYIDRLSAWHSQDLQALSVSEFTRTAHSMHYYDSMLVIEKRPVEEPKARRTGAQTLADASFPASPPVWRRG